MADFADLHLPTGFPIQVQINSGVGARFLCKLQGCVRGQALILMPINTKGQEPLLADEQLVARLMVGRGICSFNAKVIEHQQSPMPLIYISYPQKIDFQSIRKFERVEANQRIVVNNTLRRSKVSEGVLKDISMGGARIETLKPVAEPGEEISISGEFSIGEVTQGLRLNAIVRSEITPPKELNPEANTRCYGVEFRESHPHKKLVLFGHVNFLLARSLLPTIN